MQTTDTPTTATWAEFATEAPELAAAVRARFEWTKHHVLATLRADGFPRVSGSEVAFFHDDLVIGSMWQARKAHDLQRDGRCAVHSNPGAPEMVGGDAKVTAIAVEAGEERAEVFRDEVGAPPGPFHLFRLELTDVAHVGLHPAGDRIVVRRWRPGHGVTEIERA